jgi:PTS system galactitol-specific IIC component
MSGVIDALNYIAGLGPSVMMPIIILVIGLIFRVKFSTLVKSALLTGVGFYGVNMVINGFVAVVAPIAQQMVNNWGLSTNIVDVGWPARAAATWSFSLAPVVVFVILGLNVLMLVLKKTRCVMVDFWSYNHFIFTSALVFAVTNNAWIAILFAAIDAAITFKLADWTQPLCAEYFGLDGVSFPTSNSVCWAPVAWALNKFWDLFPALKNSKADPESINQKFGILGDPLIVGVILGAIIAVLGGSDLKTVLTCAICTGATMTITPKMMQILMDGLMPFADAVKGILNSRFSGSNFHIGIDAALTIANDSAIAVGVLMVPITLALAIILPYNHLLPITDIAYQAMWLAAWPVAFGKGNVLKGLLSTIVITCIMLFIATTLAPIHTAMAVAGGFTMPAGVSLISTEDAGTHLTGFILFLLSHVFH